MEYLKSHVQDIKFYPKTADSFAKGRKIRGREKLLGSFAVIFFFSRKSSGLDDQVVMWRERCGWI